MENKKTEKIYNKRVLGRLLKYAKPYLGWFLLASVFIVIVVKLDLELPKIIKNATNLIDNAISSVSPAELVIKKVILCGVRYLAFVVAILCLSYLQAMVLNYVGQKVIYTIRIDVFKHLDRLSINYFNSNPLGKLVTRVTNDIETLNEMYTSVIVNVLKSICMLFGIVITMLGENVKLSLITFTIFPFIVLFTYIFNYYAKDNQRHVRAKVAALNAFISEHVIGMKIVQIFSVEDKILSKFKNKSEALRKRRFRQIKIHSIYGPTTYILKIVAFIMLFYYGGGMYLKGIITIGVLVEFQQYINKFFQPIQEFAEQLNIVQAATASAERIFKLLDEQPDIKDIEYAVELGNVKGEIEFKNVWFAYKEDEWILKDVSFRVKPGQSVAFVGATGAGKTTIQNLITRYYDIQKGQILIDGIDIKKIKTDSLRKQIGQMLQDVFLFTGDIKSNIRLKNEDITEEEIINAAKYVNADNFISKLKNGYDEEVIERGASLSAGQRQLLSFARTLAFKPKILILDEATANIDTETEILIQDALTKIMKDRTTLIVAHRLSTIQNADNIVVLHKGKIMEQGTHQELLTKRGMYYKLYKLQYEH